jgi:hypothetical protein
MTAYRIPEIWYLTCNAPGCEESTEACGDPPESRVDAEHEATDAGWVTTDDGRHYCAEHADVDAVAAAPGRV